MNYKNNTTATVKQWVVLIATDLISIVKKSWSITI